MGFIRNAAGDLVSDRRFNTSSILATYLGPEAVGPDRIAWDVDNPNRLKLSLPGVGFCWLVYSGPWLKDQEETPLGLEAVLPDCSTCDVGNPSCLKLHLPGGSEVCLHVPGTCRCGA